MYESYLSFSINKETFAINVSYVLEVLETEEIIKPPNTVEYIDGIIEFREQFATAINTHKRFNFKDINEKHVFIVLEIPFNGKNILIAAKADRVKGVIDVNVKTISPVPDMGSSKNDFFTGLIREGDNHIMIIDPLKVFTENELRGMAKNIDEIKESK